MTTATTRTNHSRPVPWRAILVALLISLVSLYGWQAINQPDYAPGSTTGYRLGLVGALMMLALLIYPMRKHVRWLRDLGRLSDWLQIHMLLGICGPTLILFHSGFQTNSMNAAVAMWCMVVVALSGIVGRFFYGRIHSRLNGRKLVAAELNRDLDKLLLDVERGGGLPPRARELLIAFEARAVQQPDSVFWQTLRFLRIAAERRRVQRAVHRELARTVDAHRRTQIEVGLRQYLTELQRVAQFAIYERLFAAWHLLHLPLFALLLVSAIFHVVAVHMY